MNIDFFDCLMFFKSTHLFVFSKLSWIFPLSHNEDNMSQIVFSYKDLKDIWISFFRKLFLNVAIYTLNQYTHKIPEYFLSKKC